MRSTITFSLILIAIALGLLWFHRRSWLAAGHVNPGKEDLQFARRQYRRRAQTSGLIILVALVILGSHWVERPLPTLLVWGGVTLLVLWICLLAAADWLHTRAYFHRVHDEQIAQRAALEAEMRRLLRHRSNGRSDRS
jgi:hypothetical protein